ncbi:LppU/SCO3897 family protein [Micromonosporaceae bacterium Da 78-11]
MSQNGPYSGPPWSSGPPGSSGDGSDEPYSEPADPWGESAAAAPWVEQPPVIPHQPGPAPYESAGLSSGAPMWGQPPPPPRRNTPMIALVVALGLLICVGLGTTAWLLKERNDKADTGRQAQSSAAATSGAADPAAPAPQSSEDARFVKEGQCVVNEGSREKPAMRQSGCTTGTYEVLKRVNGTTSGEKDAEDKCGKVAGYTQWYFYDSELDDLDFVLCLKERKAS